MNLAVELSLHLTAVLTGLFAGAMFTEGLILVPFWRSLTAPEFFQWYATNERRLLAFFTPLTAATALVAIFSATVAWLTSGPERWWSLVTAGLFVLIVSSFYVYFRTANARFAAATLRPADLTRELSRWAVWHHARTVLSLAAATTALMTL